MNSGACNVPFMYIMLMSFGTASRGRVLRMWCGKTIGVMHAHVTFAAHDCFVHRIIKSIWTISNEVKTNIARSFRLFVWFWMRSIQVSGKFLCSLSEEHQARGRSRGFSNFQSQNVRVPFLLTKEVYFACTSLQKVAEGGWSCKMRCYVGFFR